MKNYKLWGRIARSSTLIIGVLLLNAIAFNTFELSIGEACLLWGLICAFFALVWLEAYCHFQPTIDRLANMAIRLTKALEKDKQDNKLLSLAITEMRQAIIIRVAFINHPNEPMNSGGKDWSNELEMLDALEQLAKSMEE